MRVGAEKKGVEGFNNVAGESLCIVYQSYISFALAYLVQAQQGAALRSQSADWKCSNLAFGSRLVFYWLSSLAELGGCNTNE